jgi:hypothetical protein
VECPERLDAKRGIDAAVVDEICRAVRALARDQGFALVGANAATEHPTEAFRFDGIRTEEDAP